jgi:uncharacterized membrane protein
MKKSVVVVGLVCLGLIILINSGVVDSLVLFLLVGIVPGTNYAVPSNIMLLVIFSIVWLIVVRFAAIELFYFIKDRRAEASKTNHKKRMPKRRYSQI